MPDSGQASEAAANWANANLSKGATGVVGLHLADTALALWAGSKAGLADPKFFGHDPLDDIARAVSAARATEIDDIHREACVTPGAIITPTILGLLARGKGDPQSVGPALVAGYDAMVSFGLGLGGPDALYKGVWPTLAAAPLGAAVAAARVMNLDAYSMLQAMAIAAPFCGGVLGHPNQKHINRWWAAGQAARIGASAALNAARGMHGDPSIIPILADTRGEQSILDTSFKPYCAAKQTISAIAAFESLIHDGLAPIAIEKIEVRVPPAYQAMISNQPSGTNDRLGSIVSVAYQLALTAYTPERLFDVVRIPMSDNAAAMALASCTSVVADDHLALLYPSAWPAEVRVTTAAGEFRSKVEQAPGDPGTGFDLTTWRDKVERVAEAIGANSPALLMTLTNGLEPGKMTLELARDAMFLDECPASK